MSHAGRQTMLLVPLVALLAVGAGAQSVPPNPYAAVEKFLKLPSGRTIGSTAALHVDRDGRGLWVFDRCGAAACVGSTVAPILLFDQSGALVTSFGAGVFIRPHGIYVDPDGNIWVTDGEGPDGKDPNRNGRGHQVFKFNRDGKLLLTLGTAGVAGNGPDTFNQPSQVVVAPNGDVFVGDGHGGNSNARIVKFSRDGKFIKTWGRKGTGPGEFEAPHGLGIDSKGRLFVADRGNNRLQLFDQDGAFLEEWKQFGRPSGLYIDNRDTIYVADSQSNERTNPGWTKGIRIGSARDGKVVAFIPDPDPEGTQEGVAADAAGTVYGSLTGGMGEKIKKYVRK